MREASSDHTQFEKNNSHYDPSSKEDNPKWPKVNIWFVQMMKYFMTLVPELKTHLQAHKAPGGPLKNRALSTFQGLSIQPLTQEEFDFILRLQEKEPSELGHRCWNGQDKTPEKSSFCKTEGMRRLACYVHLGLCTWVFLMYFFNKTLI